MPAKTFGETFVGVTDTEHALVHTSLVALIMNSELLVGEYGGIKVIDPVSQTGSVVVQLDCSE